MKRTIALFACAAAVAAAAAAQSAPSAAELLARADNNEVYDSIVYRGRMIIEYQGKWL